MNNKELLIIHLDGGSELKGFFVRKENDKLFISDGNYVHMIFKNKISAITYVLDIKIEKQKDAKMTDRYNIDNEGRGLSTNTKVWSPSGNHPPQREYSGLEADVSGVSLPSDILIDDPKSKGNDFSVFFSNGLSKINITSEE